MSLELRSDYISGSEGHYHHLYADHFTLHGGVDLLDPSDTGNFVSNWETGNFVSKWETGDHGGGGGGVGAASIGDLSDVETAAGGHTPDEGEVLTWDQSMGHWMPKELETGNFVSNWETGDHGGAAIDTGNFVSNWETGALIDHPINWATTPISTGSIGTEGDIAFDADYIYVCITDNKWRRGPLSTW